MAGGSNSPQVNDVSRYLHRDEHIPPFAKVGPVDEDWLRHRGEYQAEIMKGKPRPSRALWLTASFVGGSASV